MLNTFLVPFRVTFAALWSIFWISLALLVTLLTRNPDIALVMARRLWAPGLLWVAGAKIQLEAMPALDWNAPHVFTLNHRSALDIPVAFAVLPANLRFLAKHTLGRIPFLGWYMRATRMVFVDRTSPTRAVKSLQAAGKRVREGATLLTFPEGTRARDGRVHPFKRGAFAVALEAGVPIVPVALVGTDGVLPPGSFRAAPGTVRVRVGTPIPTQGRGADEREALASEAQQRVAELCGSLTAPPAASPRDG
ncbi:MAG: lysophospholipid acyltransferase family protein [Myxococcaceae bacterium]